ncbi:Maleylacetoacetate isomerase [Thozetella sp. PMI_491]|nr:Maleylacetoacetate isomerase [Thozetella sp. PMI_491]
MASQGAELTLYTYFRSSCSARVRTAAALKGIELKYEYVNLLKNEQSAASYVSDVNPSGTVPTLVVRYADGSKAIIHQSVAILEFLEEAFPDLTPLLPPLDQPVRRAQVRDLVNILAVDVQPKTNLCVLKRLEMVGIESKAWCNEQMVPGLRAFDAVVKNSQGKHAVGDSITLADVVLAPAVEGALRWGIDLNQFPELKKVYEAFKNLPEVAQADWKHQPDTPDALRAAAE